MKKDVIIKLSNVPPKVITDRSDNFREITQDRVMGGIREGYFIYIIQSELFDTNKQENINLGNITPDDIEEKEFVDEVQVKLSPQQMVKMHDLFGRLIKNYEQIYGKIKTLEQIVNETPELLEDTNKS